MLGRVCVWPGTARLLRAFSGSNATFSSSRLLLLARHSLPATGRAMSSSHDDGALGGRPRRPVTFLEAFGTSREEWERVHGPVAEEDDSFKPITRERAEMALTEIMQEVDNGSLLKDLSEKEQEHLKKRMAYEARLAVRKSRLHKRARTKFESRYEDNKEDMEEDFMDAVVAQDPNENEMRYDGDAACFGDEYEANAVYLSAYVIASKRTSLMTRGGRRPSMSVLVIVGDGDGQIGFAVGKGDDFGGAREKAIGRASRSLVRIPSRDGVRLLHDVHGKWGATHVNLMAAPPGTGIRLHQSLMRLMELAGLQDVIGKVRGSPNPLNMLRATFKALASQETLEEKVQGTKMNLIEYHDVRKPPRVILTTSDPTSRKQYTDEQAAIQQAKRRFSAKKMAPETKLWLEKFPLPLTPKNLRLAQLIRSRQLHEARRQSGEIELEGLATDKLLRMVAYDEKNHHDIVRWLKNMPHKSDFAAHLLADTRIAYHNLG